MRVQPGGQAFDDAGHRCLSENCETRKFQSLAEGQGGQDAVGRKACPAAMSASFSQTLQGRFNDAVGDRPPTCVAANREVVAC